jgi:hypothetical protein|nr:MAG TPA: hypothetical protein [Caudoviricetes sp.]
MQFAQKGNSACRIPDSKAAYYKALGYSLTDLNVVQVGEIQANKVSVQKKEEIKKTKD